MEDAPGPDAYALVALVAQVPLDPVVLEQQFLELPGWVHSIAISPDNRLLAVSVCDQKGAMHLWDMARNEEIGRTHPSRNGHSHLRFEDEKTLLAVTHDLAGAVIEAWEATPPIPKLRSWSFAGTFVGMSRNKDRLGDTLVTFDSTSKKTFTIYYPNKFTSEQLEHNIVGWSALSADGKRLVAVARPAGLKVWAIPGGRELAKIELEHESSYRALALSPDGSRVAADAWVWSTTEKGVQKKVLERAGGTALAPSPNSKYIAYSISKMIEIYVVDSGQRVARCHPSSPINPTGTVLSFSPDGSMLAVGDAKGKVRWWQLPKEVSR